ncbi:MAG: DUF501 domain-containing protein [Actinomycetota bacterium]
MRGSWGVAARCHLGVPMVIESHPLMEDGSPFPTTFWLTCPILVRRASGLEASGTMAAMTERLARDRALRERLEVALRRYRERRDAHLVIKESGGPPGGGPDRVKCLHAHLAHELADPPNPIGALALAATEWPDCVEPCVMVEKT